MLAVVVAEAVVLLLLGALVIGLLRSHAEILRTLHEAGLGGGEAAGDGDLITIGPTVSAARAQPASDIGGLSLDGDAMAVGIVGVENDTLIAFLSTTCHTCAPFWERFRQEFETPRGARLLIVVHGDDNTAKVRTLAAPEVLVVVSSEAWDSYGVPGSPHFVYVQGGSGRVLGEGTGASWSQVHDLIEHAVGGGVGAGVGSPRDNAVRIDRELLEVGIGPGHPSLHQPVDAGANHRHD
jgi:hypothetical protein